MSKKSSGTQKKNQNKMGDTKSHYGEIESDEKIEYQSNNKFRGWY